MKLLITPAQVAELAYRSPDFINPDSVSEATIVAAQQKFIRPVFGPLYEKLCDGLYPEFVAEYVVPALALYVKITMQTSSKRNLRTEAKALILRAIQHVEANPAAYPEYDPRENILNRCSIDGGIVL